MDGGSYCMIQRQHMEYKSDRVDTTKMDKTAGRPKDGDILIRDNVSCMPKNGQIPASVGTVHGGRIHRSPTENSGPDFSSTI